YFRLSLCYQPEELEICSYSTTSSDALLLLPPSISSTSHVSKKFLIFDFGPFLKEGKLTNRFVFVVFRFKGMSEELPKRLFKPGEETQVHQINNNCKMIFKLLDNGLGFSAREIHGFLCRELLTYKDHELWFVFARRPLRFSLLEFHAVTGLQCDTSLSLKELVDWDDDGCFWSLVIRTNKGISIFELWEHHRAAVKKWSNADRIRLVYLCIIVCMVCGRDEKAPIPIKYVKLVMDLEQVRNYPWGVASFDLLCESIAEK
ncbi:unnamed protein product, partial [Brassica oleracea]